MAQPGRRDPCRMLYYALGGGHGHAVRGMAFLRRLCRRAGGPGPVPVPGPVPGSVPTLIVPPRLKLWTEREGLEPLCPPDTCRTRASLGAWCLEVLRRKRPGLFIVDVFPRGVLGELGPRHFELCGRAWLVSRWVRPGYYLHAPVRACIERRYEKLLWCEEPPAALSRLKVRQERLGPVLIRKPSECLSRRKARQALAAGPGERVVLWVGSGAALLQAAQRRLLDKVCARLRLRGVPAAPRFLSSLDPKTIFPAMTVMRGADAVVCGGGFNCLHEARALGVPAVVIPQSRLYDDQVRRAERLGAVVRSPAELEAVLGSGLEF